MRRWYQHEPNKWDEFQRRYFAELDANQVGMMELRQQLECAWVTIIFAAKELRFNNAAALRMYLAKNVHHLE